MLRCRTDVLGSHLVVAYPAIDPLHAFCSVVVLSGIALAVASRSFHVVIALVNAGLILLRGAFAGLRLLVVGSLSVAFARTGVSLVCVVIPQTLACGVADALLPVVVSIATGRRPYLGETFAFARLLVPCVIVFLAAPRV